MIDYGDQLLRRRASSDIEDDVGSSSVGVDQFMIIKLAKRLEHL